jgi:DNA repair protein RadC
MLSLNTKNKVIALHVVHIGSVNASIVHPRDIFQLAILDNATSIAIAHNHPSGDTTPSEEDINVTNRINEAGKLMGIELLDHIILGDSYLSLKEKGYL